MTIQQTLDSALRHHQAGRIQEAEALYRQVLAVQPRHPDALHLLGVIAGQSGRLDVATDLIHKAIAVAPGNSDFHSNLGVFLRNQGKLDQAIASFQQAVRLKPSSAEPHNNLGLSWTDKGQFDQAIASYQQALAPKPDYAEAHVNLGNVLLRGQQWDQAIVCYQRALAIEPDYSGAYNNLGTAWTEKGQPEQAIACFQKALALKPDYAEAFNNLGNVFLKRGQIDRAIACYQRALAIDPNLPDAHNNLGAAWVDKGQLDQGIACFQRAMKIKPDYADPYNNLGNALKDNGQVDEAIASFRQALEVNPRFAIAHDNLLFAMHYHPDADSQDIFIESQGWNRWHAEPLRPFIQPHSNDRDPQRRLRIGYVSPDFREHSVAYFLESLLANHDPAQVEIFCYANLRRSDDATARLQRHAHHWQNIIGLSDAQVTDQIRRDGIDILVDLAGHTADNRLLVFAHKPAPIQVTYLGYPNTTGMSAIDYRLSDALADPPGNERDCTEELVRLPGCFVCFCPPPSAPPPASVSKGITFGSFNAHPKINFRVIAAWSRLLRQLPRSRLLLKNKSLANPSTRDRLLKSFAEQGIAPDRIDLRSPTHSLAEHLVYYHQIDIALDTFPYNGTTTTCEALWMGVPVITLAGQSHMSRVGVSLLTNAGLPELIAQTTDQYVQMAADLAGDPSHLQTLRTTLRERMQNSPLMDAERFARNIESAYRQMRASGVKKAFEPGRH